MSKVYVLMLDEDYEGSTLVNVFSNEDAARKYCKAHPDAEEYGEKYRIQPMDVIDEVNVTETSAKYDEYEQY